MWPKEGERRDTLMPLLSSFGEVRSLEVSVQKIAYVMYDSFESAERAIWGLWGDGYRAEPYLVPPPMWVFRAVGVDAIASSSAMDPSVTVQLPSNHSVTVSHLGVGATERGLRSHVGCGLAAGGVAGEIVGFEMIRLGAQVSARVVFSNKEAAHCAVAMLNGSYFDNRLVFFSL